MNDAGILPDGGIPFVVGTPASHTATPGDAGPCITGVNAVDGGPGLPLLQVIPVNTTPGGNLAFWAAQPPGSTDWYLVEQRGVIRIIRNGQFLATPFLDIQNQIGGLGNFGDERGLLGLAFHPNYAQNGRLFTMATPTTNNNLYGPRESDTVVEWRRDPGNPDRALGSKVRTVVIVPVSAGNHNGGTVLFGPDGYLWVGTGDGGGGCNDDKPDQPQQVNNLYGKMLRIDVDVNPAVGAPNPPFAGGDPRVWHYGLRNPYRFGFDPTTFDLWIGDVGQSRAEEVSLARFGEAGLNYGWAGFEGSFANTCPGRSLGGPAPHTPPIYTIDRNGATPFAQYQSVIGGVVYRGNAIPALRGVYVFSDIADTDMGVMRYCNGTLYGPTAIPYSQLPIMGGGNVNTISSFMTGNDGEIYLTWGQTGRLGRLAPR